MEVFGSDLFPFFSWVMAVGEPAVKSSRVFRHEILKKFG